MDVCRVRMSEMYLIMGKKWIAKEKKKGKNVVKWGKIRTFARN